MATLAIPRLKIPTPPKTGAAKPPAQPITTPAPPAPAAVKPLVQPPTVANVVRNLTVGTGTGQLKPAASTPVPIAVTPPASVPITTTDAGYHPVAPVAPPAAAAPVVSQPLVAPAPVPMAPSQLQKLQSQYNAVTQQLQALRNMPFSSGTLMNDLFLQQTKLAAQIKSAQALVVQSPVTPTALKPPSTLTLPVTKTTPVSLAPTTLTPPTPGPVYTGPTDGGFLPPTVTPVSPVSVPASIPPSSTAGGTNLPTTVPGDTANSGLFYNGGGIAPPTSLRIALTPSSTGQLMQPAADVSTTPGTLTDLGNNPLLYVGVGLLAYLILRRAV